MSEEAVDKSSFPFTTIEKKDEDTNISINPDTRLAATARPEVISDSSVRNQRQQAAAKTSFVLKEIKYFNQLTSLEKMKCQTALMQGIIRGYTIPDLPIFIKAKTKLLLAIPVVQQLIKNQKAEDKQWYYQLARDNIAYVSSYRKAITSIEEYQREIWLLTLSDKSDSMTKLNCYKELHSLTKTLVLLLRDLPFITQLSKYYDIDKITNDYIANTERQKQPIESHVESDHMGFNPIRRLAVNQRQLRKQESGLYVENDKALTTRDQFDGINVNLAYKILNDVKNNKIYHNNSTNPNRIEPDNKVTDEVMESMQTQMKDLVQEGDEISEEDMDSIRKLQEQAAVEHHLSKIEDEIDNLGGIDNLDKTENGQKLKDIMNKYEDSLSFLDSFMTDEQRDSVRNIRKLKED